MGTLVSDFNQWASALLDSRLKISFVQCLHMLLLPALMVLLLLDLLIVVVGYWDLLLFFDSVV